MMSLSPQSMHDYYTFVARTEQRLRNLPHLRQYLSANISYLRFYKHIPPRAAIFHKI